MKKLNATTWKEIAKDDPKDRIEVIIGDDKQPDIFYPQVKLQRWSNEVNFSVRLKDTEYDKAEVKTDKDKIKWSKGNIDIEYYNYTEGEGGYKMVWYLKSKPATNKVEFSLQSKGLNFYRQPPLTQEYQNGYSEEFQTEIVVTETQVKDLEGNVLVERPEKYVDSWAIYHKTKGGMVNAWGKDYKVGKFGHIPRIVLIDANGWKTWGKLIISDPIEIIGDTEIRNYSVEIPEDFYNNAVYPIRSNDEFGYEDCGQSEADGAIYDVIKGSVFTGVVGTVDSISAWITGGGSFWHPVAKAALYQHSDSGKSCESTEINLDSDVGIYEYTFPVSGSPSISTIDYVIVAWSVSDGHTFPALYYDSGDTEQGHYDSQTYNSFPTTASFVHDNNKYSIYCTYTAAAEEKIGPFPTHFRI